ncbi:hypothetical protein BGX38DRAFT_1250176 [Terfezia claveryi]|nr:hypothetical protein BGX38DRAFT_1250176 [Terfezia claveryi]
MHDNLSYKLDRNIIPLVMALYLFSFLDRVNIGNARLYGLEEDLGLIGVQFQVAVSILFVTYIIPSNLVLKKFHSGRYIVGVTVGWGVVAALTGVVRVRLLLGALEAGLFPGLTVYLTFFYTKRELALRIGYIALAGACGGLLAYCIGFMDGVAGGGGFSFSKAFSLLGVLAYFVLADDPDDAGYLTPGEKLLMKERMLGEMGQTKKAMEFHSLTIPCYLLGALTYLLTARLSDTYQYHAFPTLIGCTVSISGNSPRYGKRTAGSGFQLSIGNVAGVVIAVYLPDDARASGVLGCGVCGVVVVVCEDQYEEEGGREDWKVEGKEEDCVRELGDEA